MTSLPQLGPLPEFDEPPACLGRGNLFDLRHDDESIAERDERHQEAILICRQCPDLRPCERFVTEVRAIRTDDALGVWAGRVYETSDAALQRQRYRERLAATGRTS